MGMNAADISKLLSTVKGNPTPEELAVLMMEFSASKGKSTRPKTNNWNHRQETEGLAATSSDQQSKKPPSSMSQRKPPCETDKLPPPSQFSDSPKSAAPASISISTHDSESVMPRVVPSVDDKDAKIAALESEINNLRLKMVAQTQEQSESRTQNLGERRETDGSGLDHASSLRMIPADGQAARSSGSLKLYATTHMDGSAKSPASSVRSSVSSDSHKRASTSLEPVSHMLADKSPREHSTGFTGHHIPDGTDYSFQGDNPARNMSRDNMVGVEDIETADSRGFDLINRGNEPHEMNAPRDRKYSHESVSCDRKLSGASSMSSPSNRQQENIHLLSTSPGSISTSDLNQIRKTTRVDSITSPVQGIHKSGQSSRSMSPRSPAGLVSAQSRFSPAKDSILTSAEIDSMCMPPPPLPSFKHGLRKKNTPEGRKETETPLLLTSKALTSTHFAQEFLKRDAPELVQTSIKHFSDHAETSFNPYLDKTNLLPHLHDNTDVDASRRDTFHHLYNDQPMYHSTPFPKDTGSPRISNVRPDTTVNETQFTPMDNLIMTSSAMHTMMATGHEDLLLQNVTGT